MKKEISIKLYASELIYDVQNKTYLTGRSRSDGKNHEQVANMQANDDEENENQVVRSIGNAWADIKMRLSEYIVSAQTSGNNAQIDKDTNLEVTLKMPSNYNQATVDTISTALHQFIVNTAIADWFTITNKTDAKDYLDMAIANIAEIREAINKRVRPTRPEPEPTGGELGSNTTENSTTAENSTDTTNTEE